MPRFDCSKIEGRDINYGLAEIIIYMNDLSARLEALERKEPSSPRDMTHYRIGELYECYRNGKDKILTPYRREECPKCLHVWNPNSGGEDCPHCTG